MPRRPCSRVPLRGLSLMVMLLACAISGPARAQSNSTYQMTCTHIGAAGSTLFADCRRNDGSFNRTEIPIPGVENINGGLRFHGMGYVSTFQNSCTHIGVAGGTTLVADCRRMDGSFNRTSIPIFGIENANGVLRYQ
jgi:CVNH domain